MMNLEEYLTENVVNYLFEIYEKESEVFTLDENYQDYFINTKDYNLEDILGRINSLNKEELRFLLGLVESASFELQSFTSLVDDEYYAIVYSEMNEFDIAVSNVIQKGYSCKKRVLEKRFYDDIGYYD